MSHATGMLPCNCPCPQKLSQAIGEKIGENIHKNDFFQRRVRKGNFYSKTRHEAVGKKPEILDQKAVSCTETMVPFLYSVFLLLVFVLESE